MIPAPAARDLHPRCIGGIGEVAAGYDGYILDLWGVVHDGIKPFPTTVPTLKAMRDSGAKIWLLSNAPRRAHMIAEHLASIGVTPDLYDGLMTSGEATYCAMRDVYLKKWGNKVFHIGTSRDYCLFEDIGVDLVKTLNAASFIVCTGNFASGGQEVADYMPLLQEAAGLKLPMICANPDKVVHVGDQLILCPGTLAAAYEEIGGAVVYYGKPYPDVYKRCLDAMPGRKILAVGDGMGTDIKGAQGAGIDSALVVSGIHRENFDNLLANWGQEWAVLENQAGVFWNSFPAQPRYLLRYFSW